MGMERNKPIIWTREFTKEQFDKVWCVQKVWKTVFEESPNRGHYAPVQVVARPQTDFDSMTVEHTKPDGEVVAYHLSLWTIALELACQIYRRALGRTIDRYPDFQRIEYVDGAKLGERQIHWLNKSINHAWPFLENQIWKLIEQYNEPPLCTVRERLDVKPCAQDSDVIRGPKPRRTHISVQMVVDTPALQPCLKHQIEWSLKRGIIPATSYGAIREVNPGEFFERYFAQLSDSELAILNREDARKPLSHADCALFHACKSGDGRGIESALHAGADPNAVNDAEYTPLVTLIENVAGTSKYLQGYPTEVVTAEEFLPDAEQEVLMRLLLDAGAHPDLLGLEETGPIATAVLRGAPHIVRLLLEYGADSGVNAYGDRDLGEWGDAWHWAYTDSEIGSHPGERESASDCLKVLEERSIAPYSEVKKCDGQ